nr:hypothetical protein [Escherichia coli]
MELHSTGISGLLGINSQGR